MRKIDKIEVLSNGVVQVREIEQLELANGTFIDGGFHRYVLTPDTVLTTITDEKLKSICSVTWTDQVKIDYINRLEESKNE